MERSRLEVLTSTTPASLSPSRTSTGTVYGVAFTVSVDGKGPGLNGRIAILDSSPTLITAPGSDTKTIHAEIPGSKTNSQGDHIIPCTDTAVVSLTFGGLAFDTNLLDLLFVTVDNNYLKGDCYPGIVTGQVGTPEE